MKLKLQTPMKKEEETKVAHNSSTYSEYTKTQFKYSFKYWNIYLCRIYKRSVILTISIYNFQI